MSSENDSLKKTKDAAASAPAPAANSSKPANLPPQIGASSCNEVSAGGGASSGIATNCIKQTAPQSTAVVVYQASPDPFWQKAALAAPSLITSLAALLLSALALKYNKDKDRRARTQSIQDDFWLRKVVSPTVIEPFVKETNELLSSLPGLQGGTGSQHPTAVQVQDFWTLHAKKLNDYSGAFQTLELIDSQLPAQVAIILESFEDTLSIYCGQWQEHFSDATKPVPNAAQALQTLRGFVIQVLKVIHSHQEQVGHE